VELIHDYPLWRSAESLQCEFAHGKMWIVGLLTPAPSVAIDLAGVLAVGGGHTRRGIPSLPIAGCG
jgi:hypothetical protein